MKISQTGPSAQASEVRLQFCAHCQRPNPSVNLTRNSVSHLPGMARYAHNALPGKRVTLPHAGYLKR
jgi:hypothetical protein